MPRSSKHKSSKHSSRDTRDYSDSDKDSSLKDRKGKDESTAKVLKDSSFFEKRKPDSKDVHGFGNGENSDEYASSKRRKERSNDGVGDRWNGGEDERGEGSKKSKTSGDSKSRRRDESVGVYGEGEEVKKSSSKGEGKHKEPGRKESRESGMEKERKFKEVRSERSVDNEEQRMSKHVYENTDLRALDELRSPELDGPLEKRLRKKRDDTSDGNKHQDDTGDSYSKRLSSRDEIPKDGRLKDEKRKDEKYREKGREETDKENKHRYDKQRDERPAKDHASNRSDDKHGKEEKDYVESRQKRIRTLESDRDRDHNRDRDGGRERDLESGRDRERRHERERDRERDYDLDRDRDYDRDWDWDNDRDHDEDLDKDRHRERNHRHDRDGSHLDERSVRSKESGSKKRNLGEDYCDTKSRGAKTHYLDAEKRSVSGCKADSEADRGRSQARHVHADSSGTSNKRRSSPAANTHTGTDDYRNANSEDSKLRDSTTEQRTKGLRDGYSGTSERGANKYKSEKSIKIDDGTVGDFATERSSSSKASPKGLVERSPSSTSIERRYVKSGARRSLEIEESGRRNSIDGRDFSAPEDRLGRELTLERPLMDESAQADSSYYGRTSQGNASLVPPPPFRAGLDRPFMNSVDDDVRDSSNARYRRISDPGFGRGPGNSWRGVPNWTTAVPNGFVPFQHGPTHGGFQAIMPQFPSQPLFGVRPPMDVNHAGIPYHIPDADRFPGHLRPLGWQNMMDGTGPSHLHGWDGNNGVYRDDPHMYGGSDWDRNRHPTNSRSWESGSETWKEQNGDLKKDVPSPARKDGSVTAEVDDGFAEQDIQISQDEPNQDSFHDKAPEIKSPSVSTPSKAPSKSLVSSTIETVPDTPTSDIAPLFSHFYLSKLDISEDLTLPELHNQCMGLLRIDKSSSIDADSCADLFLKNGSRARQKYASTILRHSPLPAIDTSIFQRALELYKKQRVGLPNGGRVDVIPAFNQVRGDESPPIHISEKVQVSVLTSDARVKPESTSDSKIVETSHSPAEEHLQEPDQACSQKGQDQVCANSLGLVLSGPSDHGNKGEPLGALGEKEEAEASETVGSGESKENQSMEVENKSLLVPDLHKDDVDTLGGPLIFEEGSSKACDALMAGSNESESVILSRIHHSPESTH
ncbi:hypothetical protein K1719_025787 [Acacia pycnantha]|nr:hypothetical protein K1719_025787 [Acacia pycnantha]